LDVNQRNALNSHAEELQRFLAQPHRSSPADSLAPRANIRRQVTHQQPDTTSSAIRPDEAVDGRSSNDPYDSESSGWDSQQSKLGDGANDNNDDGDARRSHFDSTAGTTLARGEEVVGDAFVEAAENPLQMLTQTSSLFLNSEARLDSEADGRAQPLKSSNTAAYISEVFGGYRSSLDLGGDIDPIDLGLVDMAEAETLFSL
jgi:hypothetical protein